MKSYVCCCGLLFFALLSKVSVAAGEAEEFRAGVYSSAITIFKDHRVSPETVKNLLEARGYREVPDKPQQSGEFSVTGSSFHILTREFEDQQGVAFPKMNLLYTPSNGRIENKLGLAPDGIHLEPLLLAPWEGAPAADSIGRFAKALSALQPEVTKLKVFTMLSPELQQCAEQAIATNGGPGQRAIIALDQKTRNIQVWAESGESADSLVTTSHELGSIAYPFSYLLALDPTLGAAVRLSPLDLLTLPGTSINPQPSGSLDSAGRGRMVDPLTANLPPEKTFREIAETFLGPGTAALNEKLGSEKLTAVIEKYRLKTTSLLNLSAAFAAISAGGRYQPAAFYYASTGQDGKLSIVKPEGEENVGDPAAAFVLTDMLRGAANFGAAARIREKRYPRDAAAAIGRSPAGNDAWFIGYTPNFLSGVWVGSTEGNASESEAADVWTSFMLCIDSILPAAEFQAPAGLRMVPIDRSTFQGANRYCPRQAVENIVLRADDLNPAACTTHDHRTRNSRNQEYQPPTYQTRPDYRWQKPDDAQRQNTDESPRSSRNNRSPARRQSNTLDSLFNNIRRGANNLWRR